jgi:hypothetical protein
MADGLADRALGATETLQNAAVATGNGVAISMVGYNALTLQVTIATTATITFEGSIDNGATYFGVGLKAIGTGVYALTATATGVFVLPADFGPLTNFRARISAWTSGAVTAVGRKISLG